MFRVRIRSRAGNVIVGALGVLYAVSAASLLLMYIVQSWGATSLIDRALQMVLAGTVVAGIWFVWMAWTNLNELARSTPPSQQHRANAAVLT